MNFVQLQVKSSYTLLESTIKIDDLIQTAKNRGYNTVALTDYNVLYGALEFYQKAKEAGVKPIIGLTLDVESVLDKENSYPLLFLAKNIQGYKQLMQLSSKRMVENKAVSLEFLSKHQSDLITITPGRAGELEQNLLDGREDSKRTLEIVSEYKRVFEDLYIGIQLEKELLNIKDQLLNLGLPNVALGNVQYLNEEDVMAVEVLKHIKENTQLTVDTTAAENFSLKTDQEMRETFLNEGLEQAADETLEIAKKIDLQIDLNKQLLPKFEVPSQQTTDAYLEELCLEGLKNKVSNPSQNYYDRLEKELRVISEMGFSDYFLIVWDVMEYAHRSNIITGAGRGSAAASLVAYSLNITNVDPIEYNLLFERFLNKDRYTMPDIDLDFPDNKRDQILTYVKNRYGNGHVAQIITFGTYAAKMSVRDSARVFGMESTELKKWSSAIPSQLKITLDEAYEQSEKLRQIVAESEKNKRIFDIAKRIEGLPRHTSTHAAGVVISEEPLLEHVPLEEGNGELLLTQFTMEDVEMSGLLKMDFLALKNLTILADCIHYSQYEGQGSAVDPDQIPLDDDQTLNLFRKADTNGIFQFESDGIKRILKRISPTHFEDVVAVNALYRPGPMEQIDTFIKRKKGKESISYPHEDLKEILEVTYGVMVYQEQVMKVASKMAGYSLSEADQLRRTMSKKIQAEMDAGRKKFVAGSLEKGYGKGTANEVYNYIDRFANYGFNRAHSVAYSVIAYQLAYFKVHYPTAFFASLLKNYSSNKNKTNVFSSEAKERNIKFIGPDVNSSEYTYKIKSKNIQLGLKNISGLNSQFIYEILTDRKNEGLFKDIIDFVERLLESIQKPEKLHPLIYAGAFDSISFNRATAVNSLENIFESVEKSGGNVELFELTKPRIKKAEEYSLEDRLSQEFEHTGYYLSDHPSSKFDYLRKPRNISYINQLKKDKSDRILASIKSIRTIQTKKGIPMSFVEVSDDTGSISLTLFPSEHRKFIQNLHEGDIVLVEGKTEQYKSEIQMIAKTIIFADELKQDKKILYLRFKSLKKENEEFEKVQKLLKQNQGTIPVMIFENENQKYHQLKENYWVKNSNNLYKELEFILGEGNVVLK